MSENAAEAPPEQVAPEPSESAPERASGRQRNRRALLLVIGGVLVAAGAAALVPVLAQPSAIERAGAECSGSQPFDNWVAESHSNESPTPATASAAPDSDGQLEELFSGVISVEDGGKTLIVSTKPQDEDPIGATSLVLDCVYEQLDVPEHISVRIGQTRSLDGRQDGTWDGYTASWSYHPDSGANLIIVRD